jgi:HYDIN/CFA65/VesB family protein/ASPM-SPD-2-Hydin domain-containing protein/centrosomal CEP192-like protein
VKEFWARWATIVLLLTLTTILGRQTLSATVSPGQLSVNPSSINFGNVPVGQNQSQTATLTNSGGTNATITQATVSGTGFSVRGLSLPLTLSPGQSTTVSVNFTPGSSGSQSGTVSLACSISVNPGNHKGQTNSSVAATVTMTVSGSGVIQGQLAATPSPISLGNVVLGSSQTQSAMLTNSGASNVTISQATVTGGGFGLSGLSTPLTLAPGQSKNFSVVFSPQSTGTATGNVAITSDATDPSLSVALLAAGVASGSLTSNPSSLSFGSVQVGSSTSLTETLTNSGGSSVTITQASAIGSGFSISGLTLPLTLIPGQSFTFGAVFAPISAGSASGSISVVSNASNSTLAISLAGTGTAAGQLTVSPSSLNFGSVVVGQSASLTASLSATGSNVTVSSATVTTPEFVVSGLSLPFTLAAGQSASLTVTFKPQASGTATASASFLSNASNSPAVESLTGNGAPPPTHSVSLSWSDSSSGIVGYNVYRGSTSGGPYTKINSFLDASTSYTDSSVQAGQTYYYVTTAVDGSGIESGYSNQVQTVIPTP